MIPPPAPPIHLAGPTASGKSALALALAETIGGEIITVDSMQVYRGMDIGTAKPGADEQQRVPHHLLDIVELTGSFDAAQFIARAAEAEAAIRLRGKVPIYCGGTGLYFKALFSGVGTAPPPDPRLREELEAMPLSELVRELQTRDPVTADRIDVRNPRRVIRALEVIRSTGRPFSEQQASWGSDHPVPRTFYAIERAPEDLRKRIDQRVEEMMAAGLVEETRGLLERGLAENRSALQAIGYRQVVEHLGGQRSLADTVELIKTRTWQFARRQKTWLRQRLRPVGLHWETGAGLDTMLDLLLQHVRDPDPR